MHTYSFNIKKDIIAVYCLWTNEERVYIGKTNKLKYRLSQHKATCEQDNYNWKKEVNKITYFECKNLTDLDILETLIALKNVIQCKAMIKPEISNKTISFLDNLKLVFL